MNSSKKRLVLPAAIFVVAVAIVSVVANNSRNSPPVYAEPKAALISITEDGFVPQNVKVSRGTIVVWRNVDGEPHHVSATKNPGHSSQTLFDSNTNLDTNGRYRFQFNQPGTYSYHDALKPQYNAVIVVK